jgi:hypothetical protein
MWQFTCGTKTCNHPEDEGTLSFGHWWESLNDGNYKAYLFEDDTYHVKASSDVFEVGHCDDHPSPTRKPTTSCHSSVEVDNYCYKDHYPTKLKIDFENCRPEPRDWIGIYRVRHGYEGKAAEWWGDSILWKFACGSKECHFEEKDGTLFFEDWWQVLKDGEYRAYLFEDDSYHVKASSETFDVDHCDH